MSNLEARIQALLTKAERTDNEHEAAVFFGKAQELMTKYQIDEAKLRGVDTSQEVFVTKSFTIAKHTPMVKAKRWMLHEIAKLNNVKMWFTSGTNKNTLAGTEKEIDFTWGLYNSLAMQLESERQSALDRGAKPDYVHGRTWNNEFAWGFTQRIVARLRDAKRDAEEDAKMESSTALVLADRLKRVEAWTSDELGLTLRKTGGGRTKYNADARAAGRAAANRADLGQSRVGTRREIGRG